MRRCRGDITGVHDHILQGEEDVSGVVGHLLGHVAAIVDDENGDGRKLLAILTSC